MPKISGLYKNIAYKYPKKRENMKKVFVVLLNGQQYRIEADGFRNSEMLIFFNKESEEKAFQVAMFKNWDGVVEVMEQKQQAVVE